ncbi:MAG: hypothetical protein D3905_06515 [Candidatus Electrothrix sp. AS4_5]|nr:hypothetical protein [Candidatus Electrothrix gigas]
MKLMYTDTQSKTPLGAALFTRKTEQGFDYNWGYAQIGKFQLLDKTKKVFATVLGADSVITGRTIFAVIQQGQRIGIVVAHLPTSRRDFNNRPISTTLYLEFAASDKADVLHSVATLLTSSYQESPLFLDYAEDLLKNPYASSPTPIELPACTTGASPHPVVKRKGLAYSSCDERYLYASYLARLPDNFCFVSTGHVNQLQYQELESVFKGGLLVLTLDENVGANTRKKNSCTWKLPYRWPVKRLVVSLAAMMLFLSVGGLIGYKLGYQSGEKKGHVEEIDKPKKQLDEEKITSLTNENNDLKEQIRTFENKLKSYKQGLQKMLKQTSQVKPSDEDVQAESKPTSPAESGTKSQLEKRESNPTLHINKDVEVKQTMNQQTNDKKVQQAKTALDNFLAGDALNLGNNKAGTIEYVLKLNKNGHNSYYQKNHCPDYLKKYHALKKLIEQNKEQSDLPQLPTNYCAKYEQKHPSTTTE